MIGQLTNHLWQSTVFVAVVGLLAIALRRNRARVRYCLWLSASLKFFVPFALLISLGRQLESVPAAQQIATQVATPAVSYTVEQLTEPFSEPPVSASKMPTTAPEWLSTTLFLVWLCGFAAVLMMRIQAWRKVRAALRASTPVQVDWGVSVRASSASIEPGVVGVLRSTLLLPEGIVNRLTPSQLAAVVAHELCHVSRRDNLTSGLHMITEALFWFHPLVWWIGARLVEERERACDEEVLRLGNEPMVYAEGILNICKFYQQSPLISVPGVTGSDLKKRIEDIMINRGALKLGFGKALLLTLVGILALMGPIAMGVVHATAGRALAAAPIAAVVKTVVGKPVFPAAIQAAPAQVPQVPQTTILPAVSVLSQTPAGTKPSFEVASIRPNKSDDSRVSMEGTLGGRFAAQGIPLRLLILMAYRLQGYQLIGGPDWLNSDRWSIEAKPEEGSITQLGPAAPASLSDPIALRIQSLLEDRFQLRWHREVKDVMVYEITVARGGPKMKLSTSQNPPPPPERGTRSTRTGRGDIEMNGVPVSNLAQVLSQQLGQPVIDKTGLEGRYDIKLQWTPERPADATPLNPSPAGAEPRAAADPFGLSILTAVQEQLGLRLTATKGRGEVFVIDSVRKATEN